MVRFDLRLNPVRVDALRRLAGRLSYESGVTVSWADLVRFGVDLVLANDDKISPARGVNNHNMTETNS